MRPRNRCGTRPGHTRPPGARRGSNAIQAETF